MRDRRRTGSPRGRSLLGAAALLATAVAARSASAQGCVVVRPTAPVTVAIQGAAQGPYLDPGAWQVSLGYRWFRSDRDYSGSEEDPLRARLKAADINDIHGLTADVAYALSRRFSLALTLPYHISVPRPMPYTKWEDYLGQHHLPGSHA